MKTAGAVTMSPPFGFERDGISDSINISQRPIVTVIEDPLDELHEPRRIIPPREKRRHRNTLAVKSRHAMLRGILLEGEQFADPKIIPTGDRLLQIALM